MRKSARLLLVAVALIATGMSATHTAGAVTVSCGQVVTQSITLTADVGPCPNNGIIAGADNIVINLNGHRVFGTPTFGDGAGVLVRSRQGVTVRSGTVTDFDGGVVILGGSGNTITLITARDNIGKSNGVFVPVTLYGDGILVQGSLNNTITSNVAERNGPYSGIGLIPGDPDHPAIPTALVHGNLVQNNTVRNNVACRSDGFCDNDGIRIEPRAGGTCTTGTEICPGPGNRIISNMVLNNGLDGIALFGFTTSNVLRTNNVSGNGFLGAARGDGIRVFGSGNTIQSNYVSGNANGGISVGRRPIDGRSLPNANGRNNTLATNAARGNLVDLWDSNPGCDNNVWSKNFAAGLALPACTRN